MFKVAVDVDVADVGDVAVDVVVVIVVVAVVVVSRVEVERPKNLEGLKIKRKVQEDVGTVGTQER